MGWFGNDWYERESKAFGVEPDIRACARVFADVGEAMGRAAPEAARFGWDDTMWEGATADLVREQMTDVPKFLRRFERANCDVAEALQVFAPAFGDYVQEYAQLTNQGRSLSRQAESTERQRDAVVSRLRSQEWEPIGFIGGLITGYEHDPEVASLTRQLEQLQSELASAGLRFDRNDERFQAAVDLAYDAVSSAEDVLYNNGWDKFWTQTAEPILEVVKIVLEVAAIVLLVAAMFVSVGTLLPLILAAGLLFVSVAQIAGTAGAGKEVTGDMWLDLAINIAAVATLGAAHYAKGLKVAANANKLQADKLLKGKTGLTNATKASAKMRNVESWTRQAQQVEKFGRRAEMLEGGLVMTEGGMLIGEGIEDGDLGKIAAGSVGMVAGGADLGGAGGIAGDVSRIGHGAAGLAGSDGVPSTPTEAPGTESPRDWPGLDGLAAE